MAINNYVVLLDNGHGACVRGKMSPNGTLKEYKYCREIAKMLQDKLIDNGIECVLITPEIDDISLSVRCRRANSYYAKLKQQNKKCFLISIHNNAAGCDGKWHNASGFSVFVSNNASVNSKKLALIFTNTAIEMKLNGNRSIPLCKYWQLNLAMCRDTNMPAVLTENLFQDNKGDVDFLLSDKGKKAIVDLHYNAIIKYILST